MVAGTLQTLDHWFNDPTQGGDRPKLVSKLAALELCGWLEGEFDRLIGRAQDGRLNDSNWVKEKILDCTSGFSYGDHFRPMLSKLVGEFFVRKVEARFEILYPGDLDRMKSMLGTLWKMRCGYAHAHMLANVAAQQTFHAPSWSINQHRILKKLILNYELAMLDALAGL